MSDEIALGCFSTLKENRFKLPDDMSIIGFDDIGRRCVEVLLNQINGKAIEATEIILPHKLVIRDSTKENG